MQLWEEGKMGKPQKAPLVLISLFYSINILPPHLQKMALFRYILLPALIASLYSISPQASSLPFTDSSYYSTSLSSVYICFALPLYHFSVHTPQFPTTTKFHCFLHLQPITPPTCMIHLLL